MGRELRRSRKASPLQQKSVQLATIRNTISAQRRYACCDLVKQAEKLAFCRDGQLLTVTALCRALAVSERTLRSAFHRIHGAPPCRHLRMLRLLDARKTLLVADRKRATVTEVATALGFSELGRFSVEYKAAFGESPSQTLSEQVEVGCTGVRSLETQRTSTKNGSMPSVRA